nr:allatotropin [Urechis unicinctus]
MKIGICLLLISVLVSIDAGPHYRNARRSFRIMGASDRFSHGFGKRGDEAVLDNPSDAFSDDITLVTDDELTDILLQNPKLTLAFVQKYLDLNGDGVISKAELTDGSRK